MPTYIVRNYKEFIGIYKSDRVDFHDAINDYIKEELIPKLKPSAVGKNRIGFGFAIDEIEINFDLYPFDVPPEDFLFLSQENKQKMIDEWERGLDEDDKWWDDIE